MWYNKLYIHVLLNSNNIESRTVISRMARKDGGRGELAVQQLYFLQNWKQRILVTSRDMQGQSLKKIFNFIKI